MSTEHYRNCEPCRKSLELRALPRRRRALMVAVILADAILSALVLWRQ